MVRTRAAAGGGVVVEIPSGALTGWVNRFAARNDGLLSLTADPTSVTLTGGDMTSAVIAVPFGPMALGTREPVEALLNHLHSIGSLGLIAVRAGAHSVGIARNGRVLTSSTDRAYLQGRTAAGGWSQQRFARRRGNQRTASIADSADAAVRVLTGDDVHLDGLVLAGDAAVIADMLGDKRLEVLKPLPHRVFGDIAEPRRSVLDDVADRSLAVEITIRRGTAKR